MADQFEEVTTTSWGQRIIGSLMGVLIGILLFIGSFPLIFWNEGRSVDRIKTLNEGRGLVVAVASDPVDPSHNGALVHIAGDATTQDTLSDQFLGTKTNVLKLKRIVEMYQWEESKHTTTEKNMGGSETTKTTYSYDKKWSESAIDSGNFKQRTGHENPDMPYHSQTHSAKNITIGAFGLTKPFIEQIEAFEPYSLTQRDYDAMDDELKQSFALSGNHYFRGNPENPQIGAMRISYEVVMPTEISAVGKQSNTALEPYYTKNGDISLLEIGHASAESMFASAKSENTLITWLVRLGAFIMMWIGLVMVSGPLSVLGDVVPFIGSMVAAGMGLISGVIALVLSFVTMAIAWIIYRPIIGIILLVIAGCFFFGGFKMIRTKLQRAQ